MTTAIHYTSVKTPTKSGQVYGLQVAVLDWLRAYMRYSRQEKLPFLVGSEGCANEIQEIAAEVGVDPARLQMLDGRFEQNLKAFSHVFRADTNPHDLLWQRNRLGIGRGFAFCGIAHAVAGREGAKILARYCEGPSTSADAIICPSNAIKSVIENYFDHYAKYLSERFGADYKCPVDLPVLPLGIDTKRIQQRVSPEKRKAQRSALGIGDDDIILLWVGRQSYAIKAHPLSMFRAAELAAKQTGKKVHLVMQGYFVPEDAGQEYEALARDICKQAKVHFIASDDARFPDGLWASGDIFLSLIDNVQESFGITPIEAIAAGLPRVISDWDGYRDHVADGEDGFLVPTYQPPVGMGDDLAGLMLGGREMYGGVLAQIAQTAVVDHQAAGLAIARLIEDPNLRKSMAEKAKVRLPNYDWSKLIPVYENMWGEQADRRKAQNQIRTVHPHAAEPYAMYKDFPTRALSENDELKLVMKTDEIGVLLQHKMNTLAAGTMLEQSALLTLMNAFTGGAQIKEAFMALRGQENARVWRSISWLMKLGVLNKA